MEAWMINTLLCVVTTVSSYCISLRLFQRFRSSWLHPLYTTTALVLCILPLFSIDNEGYTEGADIFTFFLGSATVSLAVPLYKQLYSLKQYLPLIIGGVLIGTLSGIISASLLAKAMHLSHSIVLSLIPKSATLPIALSISQSLGGIPSLTILFVILSGIFSLTIGPFLFTALGIKSRIARGLAIGTSAQALGAGRAMEWGEIEGAAGSAAMGTAALCMAILAPFLSFFSLL
jgi:predicted murein hydrolase (TIGR00659 family)